MLGLGTIATLFARKPTRRERIRALRKEILESYAAAAADPEFMRECEEIEQAFAPALMDGLPRETFDR